MIRSVYLRIFFLGLPSLYLALWLSRFSLSMVNALPYYYGMIITAFSIFCGALISFVLFPSFGDFFKKNHLQIILAEFIFLGIGHVLNIMDAGLYSMRNAEIIYYFAGLASIGLIGANCMQHNVKEEKNVLLLSFIFGSIISYFIGVQYFELAQLDIFLGSSVTLIILLHLLCINKEKSWYRIIFTILLVLINITIITNIYLIDKKNTAGLTHLGYSKVNITPDGINIYDHKRRIFRDISKFSMQNANDLLAYQLQTDKKNVHTLFIGYPGSLTPLLLYKSPFTEKVDSYFWDMPIPKGFFRPTKSRSLFFKSEWDFLKLSKEEKFDLIIIENIPFESVSSRRVFILYCKRLLNSNGVLVIPEYLARKNDGQYLKITKSSPLVMIMGAKSTDNAEELEKRFDKFISERLSIVPEICSKQNIPHELVKSYDPASSAVVQSDSPINKAYSHNLLKIMLWTGLGIYLVFRLFKSRYKNNQSLFFTFESGFTFSIILFTSLMLLSELRLVYPFFPPALFGISLMVMLPSGGKKWNFFCQTALMMMLVYFTSINFIRAFPIVYVLPVFLPLGFLALSSTLENCKSGCINHDEPNRNIYFALGVLFTLLLLICAKNNNLYTTLIYIAIISRIFYFFKI